MYGTYPQQDAPQASFYENSYTTATPQYQGTPPFYTSGVPVYTATNSNNNALVVEIILSLLGIFGVGWLLAKETTVGIILLACSILVYWPLIFLGTVFTFGLGLICLGPMAIAAIIINIVLLNSILKRKAAQCIYSQQPPSQHIPPMPPQM
jgi:hypothetical protein